MPEEWLQQHTGALTLAALVLALSALILLIVLLLRQGRESRAGEERGDALLRRVDDAARDALHWNEFSQTSEMQSARLLQAMDERDRGDAQRIANLFA